MWLEFELGQLFLYLEENFNISAFKALLWLCPFSPTIRKKSNKFVNLVI